MAYSAAVERWRPYVEKYFRPEDVDKALYVIQHESGGNPTIFGDGGSARGLFQLNNGGLGAGMSDEEKADPDTNIRVAAAAVYGGSGWKPWGENNLYQGKVFGALGNNPYPGGSGSTGGSGGQMTPGPGQQIAEQYYDDAELNNRYGGIQKRYFDAYDKWVAGGRPQPWIMDDDTGELVPNNANPLAFEFASAQEDLNAFTETFGFPSKRVNSTDPAQQAFENSIDLGDFELRKADAAYTRWLNRTKAAEAGAQAEIETAQAKNDSASTASRDWAASNYTGAPRSASTQLIEPYEKVIDKWNKKLGVGEEPGMGFGGSGIGLPPGAPATGGGATPGGRGAGFNPFAGGRDDAAFYGQDPFADNRDDVGFYGNDPAQRNTRAGFIDQMDQGFARGGDADRWDVLGERDRQQRGSVPIVPNGRANTSAGISKAGGKKKERKWWQKLPGFANGVQNFEGGPAMLGEQGPEIVEIPGFGEFEVGQSGPEERVLPPGSNVIPMNERLMYQQIKGAAREGKSVDRMKKQQEAQQRRNDPQAIEQAMMALEKALAAQMVVNPPKTPMLSPDWQGPDPWEQLRPLSGIPAFQQQPGAPAQQPAAPQKGVV